MAETKLNSSVPNLFDYATSELSQDAFLLWLLNWANPFDQQKIVLNYEQKCLHEAAQGFVHMLLDMPTDLQIESVKCYKQKFHIDVLAVVNGQYALIIEDKTDTKEHGKQIETYAKVLKKDDNFKELEQSCIYYKSGNESLHSIEKLSKFYSEPEREISLKTILRKDVIDLFTPYVNTIKDSIFVDYFNHLQKIENLTNSYQTEPANKWKEEAWQGFYMELEKQLEMGNWGADFYKDGFSLPLCPITADEKQIQLYLYIDKSRNLCIKAKCKAKCSPTNGWEGIINKIKSALKSKDLVFDYINNISVGKNIKLCDIKRLQNNKRSMFIRKTLSFSAQQPDIVNQLKELQKQLSTVADEIKKTSYIEIK